MGIRYHSSMGGIVKMIRTIGEQLLDIILPPRARALRMRSRTLSDLAITPTAHELCGITITTLFDYRSPAAQDAIRSLKYDGSEKSATLLAEALADHLREEIVQIKSFSPRPIILVPVPLHTSRRRERGFNQITRVLRALPGEFQDGSLCSIDATLLTRIRATPQQTKLSRSQRLKNVRGAFSADHDAALSVHMILIDDVVTTGATLAECVRTARNTGARVTSLALARA